MYELEGDVYALNLVDLEREGLLEYRYMLKQVSGSAGNPGGHLGAIVQSSTGATIVEAVTPTISRAPVSSSSSNREYQQQQAAGANEISTASIGHVSQGSVSSGASTSAELINELFKTLNLDVRS